jgi:hypothetical protein
MKNLLKIKLPTKKYNFMGQKDSVEIRKLSAQEVLDFQTYVKSISAKDEKAEQDADAGLSVQFYLIRKTVEGAEDITDAELKSFPLEDLSRLTEEILKYSGLDTSKTEGNDSPTKK